MLNPPAIIDLPPEALGRLLETASACAVTLLHAGSDSFTAVAGDLSQMALDELRQALQRYWMGSNQRDLNRYVGLYLEERFHYLFTKFIPHSDYLLSLVFIPKTPLVRIRQDMTDVMRKVLQTIREQVPQGYDLERSLQFRFKPYPAPIPTQQPMGRVEPESRNQRYEEEAVPDQIFPHPPDHQPAWQPAARVGQGQSSRKSSVSEPSEMDWVSLDGMTLSATASALEERRVERQVLSGETRTSHSKPPEEPPAAAQQDWQSLEEGPQPEPDLVRLFHEDIEFQPEQISLCEISPSDEPGGSDGELVMEPWEEDTQPTAVDEPDAFDQIKLSDITFYLVPRSNQHFLLGELAQRLRTWFPGTCDTYGWQLDALSVRPDYVKWRLHDFPDALIHEMLDIIRKRTSERIFRVFPNLKEGSPENDFWSPGYLVDRQNQDFSTQVLIAHLEPGRNTA